MVKITVIIATSVSHDHACDMYTSSIITWFPATNRKTVRHVTRSLAILRTMLCRSLYFSIGASDSLQSLMPGSCLKFRDVGIGCA